MKVLVVLAALALSAVYGSPTVKDPRWALIQNDDGMQLSDLHLEHQEIDPKFDVETDVLLLLYTRQNPSAGQRLFTNAESVRNSNFNPNWPVRILVHGWTGSQDSPSIVGPRDAYLQRGDFNVIGVDWAEGAQTINYITARNRVPDVGAFVARFIDVLHAGGFTNFNQVQVMGHSLGAHVAGICGKKVTRGRVQTVVGMDPAGPLFTNSPPEDRFDRNDGVYTQGIVTNGGTQGYFDPLAQANFYPNGGKSQPGCGIEITGSCSHERVHELFAESINSNNFWATRCANIGQIGGNCVSTGAPARLGGEPITQNIDGIFALSTNPSSPFVNA